MIGAPVFRYVLTPGWAGDSLARAAQAVPSLDLNFAATKTVGPLVTFTRASSATFIDSDGLIKTAAINEPRFDHNPTTTESLGLLVEEQRTNLVLRSEEFDNAGWNTPLPSIATVTPNAQIAPNGTLTADTFTTASGTPALFQTVACLASTTYTWSFYVKLGTMAAADFRFAVRDDSNGVFIAQDIAPSITPVTTEWRRVTYTFTTPVGCVLVRPYPYRFIPATYGTTVFLWGAQLEAGSFPTSYIPTTTTAVTRSADVASITGTNFSSWYRQDEGTVFAEVVSAPNNTIAQLAADISDAPGTERIFVRRTGAGSLAVAVIDGGVTQADVGAGPVISGGARYATAASYRLNSINLATNGQIGTEDTTATVPTPDRMFIGQNFASTQQVGGTIKRLAFFPQRLPDSTLQAITQ
jgi:hypothetical protein